MDGMTDYQTKIFLELILNIVEKAETKEEAVEKLKKLLDK